MTNTYTPILRWKRGERVALQQLSTAGRNDVRPLFVLGTEQYVGRKATKKRSAIPPAKVIANELDDIWSNEPFYMEALARHATTPHPLITIANATRKLGLNLIPATTLTAPMKYQNAVVNVAHKDRRGVALRVDLNQFTSVSQWIGEWPFTEAETDLIVDFADNVGTVNSLGNVLNQAFENLHHGNR